MRLSAIFSILVLPLVVTACQHPTARNIDVTLDVETTETVLNEVAADDTSIADAVEQVIDGQVTEEQVTNEQITDDQGETETINSTDNVAVLAPPPEPETPPPPPPPPSLSPDELVGIEVDELIRRFGEPDYIRIDAGVEVYQYRLPSCVVDFVAMPRAEGQPLVVTSSHRRHRKINTAYDASSCGLDLGALDQDSMPTGDANSSPSKT